jgi:hypothetical protein
MSDYYTRTSFTKGTLVRSAEANAQLQAIEEGFDKLPTEEQLKRNTTTFAVDTGTVNHLIVALPFPLLAYPGPGEGLEISAQVANTNTGEADVDVDTLGVVPVKQFNGAVLQAGDLPGGATVKLSWNGDDNEFRLQGASPGNIVAAEASATAAAASASAASSSASTASGHASTALGHANTASGHASDASGSAIAAASSADEAEAAQTAAEFAQAAAEAAQAAAEAAGPTLGTPQTASGVAIDFGSIPAGTKRITINFIGLSTDGTSEVIVQIGDAGGIEPSGYSGGSAYFAGGSTTVIAAHTTGFGIGSSHAASAFYHGRMTLELANAATNEWVASASVSRPDGQKGFGDGSKPLTGVLDRLRITTVNGTDAFDAGLVNTLYE